MNHCIRHFEEPKAADCRNCGRSFCDRCLVYSFGPNKPPFCVGCALTASGVRNKGTVVVQAAPPKVDKRAEKAQRRAEKAEAKAAARAAKQAAKQQPVGGEPDRSSTVPTPDRLTIPASRYAAPPSNDIVR